MGKHLQLQAGEQIDVPMDVDSETTQSPMSPVLRSKGFVWLDSQPNDALYWGHAGRTLRIQNQGSWINARAADRTPHTELVVIGAHMSEHAIREALDDCLIEEYELEQL